ncbi:MAG: tetratricopeptide repeat protein [Desulfobulbaceae bacterium]|jgi:hypothetical protein|nr:tetratricopeptide repeat protein [Desulfobulbaceae bacterium]
MRQSFVSFTSLFSALLTIAILSGCVEKTILPPYRPSASSPATVEPEVAPPASSSKRPQPKQIQPGQAPPEVLSGPAKSKPMPSAEEEEGPIEPEESLPPLQPKLGPAASLYQHGESHLKEGKLDKAEMFLERALRIEPRNPYYWHVLAKIRLSQGKKTEAIQCCLKSNSLASANSPLIRRNKAVIHQARTGAATHAGLP